MHRLLALFAALFLSVAALAGPPAMAGNDDPLFVNATSEDPHRSKMALMFAAKQQERKHPVTIFLNDKAVLIGAKTAGEKYAEHHTLIATIVKAGGNVLVCPMCMEHYGVKKDDLLDGVQIGNPELTGSLLFKGDTKTLSW